MTEANMTAAATTTCSQISLFNMARLPHHPPTPPPPIANILPTCTMGFAVNFEATNCSCYHRKCYHM